METVINSYINKYPRLLPNRLEVLHQVLMVLGNGEELDANKYLVNYAGVPMGCDTSIEPYPIEHCYPFSNEEYLQNLKGCRNPGFNESIDWLIACIEVSDKSSKDVKSWLENIDVLLRLKNGDDMKTSKKEYAKVLRLIADNLDNDVGMFNGIELLINNGTKWEEYLAINHKLNPFGVSYRVKPETITLSNDVVIPYPIPNKDIVIGEEYYTICDDEDLYDYVYGSSIINSGTRFAYYTKEEAITASKALFGIEE